MEFQITQKSYAEISYFINITSIVTHKDDPQSENSRSAAPEGSQAGVLWKPPRSRFTEGTRIHPRRNQPTSHYFSRPNSFCWSYPLKRHKRSNGRRNCPPHQRDPYLGVRFRSLVIAIFQNKYYLCIHNSMGCRICVNSVPRFAQFVSVRVSLSLRR